MKIKMPYFYPISSQIKKNPSGGFTLLEVLMAIFIFSVVMTTIFGSYNLIFSSADVFESGIAAYESARSCLNRISTDLQAVYVSLPPIYTPPGFDAPPDPYRFYGETVAAGHAVFPRLRFSSLAHIAFEKNRQQEGIAEIVYYVQAGDNGTYILRRSDTLYPYDAFAEKGTDPILCENLKSLKFTYYDAEGADYDYWNSDSDDFKYATPRAVGIQLELGNGSFSRFYATLITLPAFRPQSE